MNEKEKECHHTVSDATLYVITFYFVYILIIKLIWIIIYWIG